jgi:hypothetical protein
MKAKKPIIKVDQIPGRRITLPSKSVPEFLKKLETEFEGQAYRYSCARFSDDSSVQIYDIMSNDLRLLERIDDFIDLFESYITFSLSAEYTNPLGNSPSSHEVGIFFMNNFISTNRTS